MDIVVMRALLEGDDSNLQATLKKADEDIVSWAKKNRPAAEFSINRRGNLDLKEFREIGRLAANLKDKSVTYEINWKQNGSAPAILQSVSAKPSQDVMRMQREADTAEKRRLAALNKEFEGYERERLSYQQKANADRIRTQAEARTKELAALRADIQERGRIQVEADQKEVAESKKRSAQLTAEHEKLKRDFAQQQIKSQQLIDSAPYKGGALGEKIANRLQKDYAPQPKQSLEDRMGEMQARGYYSMAAGSALSTAFTAPLVAGGTAVVKFAADYEEAMQHVVTLTDVSKDELKALYGQVLQMSDDKRIRQAPVELADALYYVTSTGLKGADGLKVLKAAAIGASAGLGETSVVANTTTTVLDAYGMSADKAAKVVDVLTEAVKWGKGEADAYAAAFPKLIAIAAQAGVSFEEVAAQMASATRLGLTPSETATALRQIFQNLINPSEKAVKAFQEIGTSAGELRVMLQQKGLFNTLKDLMDRTGGRIGPITELFGSIRALTSFLATTGNSTLSEYKNTLDSINNSSGASAKAAATASETYRFQLDRLGATIQRVLIENGKDAVSQLNVTAETVGDKLPSAIKVVTDAWDDMDPAMQTVLKSMALILAAAGPLKMMAGTATILVSAFGSMAGGTGLAGLVGGVAGAAGISTLAAWPIVLAAIAAAIALAGAKWYDFSAAVEDAQTKLHNAKIAAENLQKATDNALKFSVGSASAKNAITKLAEDAKGAAGNADKLIELIRKATEVKAEIGKDMHLSPIGKQIVENEVQRLINSLSSQAIELDVKLKGAVEAAREPATPSASQAPAGPLSLADRAKAAGVALPERPKSTWQRDPMTAWTKWIEVKPSITAMTEYQNALDAVMKKINEFEKNSFKNKFIGPPAATKEQLHALTEQGKAVEKLNDAELERERTRLGKMNLVAGSEEYSRAEKVEEEFQKRRAQIQQKWATDKAAADERARIAQEEMAKAQEETAERLRRIEVTELQKRLQNWQTFSSAVETYAANLSKIGSEKGESSKLAAEAQMARKEFAGIPPELRAMVIGLAAVNDEMKRLTGTRDQMRGLFSDMFKEAVRAGSPTDGIVARAREMEKALNYTQRMQAQFRRGQGMADTLSNQSEYNRRRYSDRIEQWQGAGTMAGSKFRADAYLSATQAANRANGSSADGITPQMVRDAATVANVPKTISACANVASQMFKKLGINIEGSNNAGTLESQIKRLGVREIPIGQASPGDTFIWDTQKSRRSGEGRNYGAVSGKHVEIYEGNGRTSGNKGSVKRGNPRSLGSAIYDDGGVTVYDTSSLAMGGAPQSDNPRFPSPANMGAPVKQAVWDGKKWSAIPAPPQAAPTAVPRGSKVAQRAAVTPQLATTSMRKRGDVRTPEYDGSLLNMGLPKGWGKPVTEFGMAEGESRTWQLRIQEMLLDTKAATKLAKDMGMSLDEFAAAWKVIAKERDAGADISRATDVAKNDIKQLEKSAFMARRGGSTPLAEFMYDAGKGKYNRTPAYLREGVMNGILDNTTANMQGEGDQFRRSLFNQQKIRSFGAGRMARGDLAGADYERERGQRRLDIWNSKGLEDQRKDIASLKEVLKNQLASGTYADFYASVTTRQKIRGLQDAHDKEFKSRVGGDKDAFNSEKAEKARRAILERNLEMNKTISLLGYENSLINMNAADRERAVAIEEKRRDILKQMLDAEPNASPNRRKALEGQAYAESRRYGRTLASGDNLKSYDENKLFDDNANLTAGMNQDKLGLIGRLRPDSPELAIQLRLLEERNRLEAENLSRGKSQQIDVDKRMTTLEKQIRAEDEISRFTTVRGNALAFQNDILEAQKQNELALAKTAKEKLAIEWKYLDAKRKQEGTPTSDEEKANRARMADIAADAERIEKMKDGAGELRDMFSQAVQEGFTDPLKGVQSLLSNMLSEARKRLADSLVKNWFPDEKGGIVEMMGLGKKTNQPGLPVGFNGVDVFNDQLAQGGDPIGPRPAPQILQDIKDAITQPSPAQNAGTGSSLMNSLQAALRGGITAATVQVNAPIANVSGANVNVAGGGSGYSIFGGGGSSGRSGGGSGTTPTTTQQMETIEI